MDQAYLLILSGLQSARHSEERTKRRAWRGRPDIVVLRPRPRQGNDKNLPPPLSPVWAQEAELLGCSFGRSRLKKISNNPNSLGRTRSGGSLACSAPPPVPPSNSDIRARPPLLSLPPQSPAPEPVRRLGSRCFCPLPGPSFFHCANFSAKRHAFGVVSQFEFLSQSVGRVARLSGNVRQPNQVLGD